MSKNYILFFTSIFISLFIFSQAPEAMNYQAVIRDGQGNIIANQNVGVRIDILQGSATGTSLYQETFTSITSSYGLIALQLGTGSVISGAFSTIDWSNGPYYVETSVDINGGNSYAVISTTQFMSVPYALYAKNAELDSSAVRSLIDISESNYLNTLFFNSTSTWTCPQNIYKIYVEVWGAGGGGGGGSGGSQGCMQQQNWWNGGYSLNGAAGGSGGKGGYNSMEIDVTPGNIYNITVGQGGVGGNAQDCGLGGTGSTGGSSSFSNILSASGGTGGTGQNGTNGNSNSECQSCIGTDAQLSNWRYPDYNITFPSYIPNDISGPVPGLASGGSFGTGGSGTHSGISSQPSNGDNGENGFCIIHF